MELTLTRNVAHRLPDFMKLEAEASVDYNAFVYRDAEQADQIREFLMQERRSEFSPPYAQALLKEDKVVGALVCLEGKKLNASRLRMVMELQKAGYFKSDSQLAHRLQLAGQVFHKPEKGDFYLSRIAVAKDCRGLGLGSILLEEFEKQGAREGCSQYVFEVSAGRQDAIEFYRNYGYREIERRCVVDTDRDLSIEYVQMALPRSEILKPEDRFPIRGDIIVTQ